MTTPTPAPRKSLSKLVGLELTTARCTSFLKSALNVNAPSERLDAISKELKALRAAAKAATTSGVAFDSEGNTTAQNALLTERKALQKSIVRVGSDAQVYVAGFADHVVNNLVSAVFAARASKAAAVAATAAAKAATGTSTNIAMSASVAPGPVDADARAKAVAEAVAAAQANPTVANTNAIILAAGVELPKRSKKAAKSTNHALTSTELHDLGSSGNAFGKAYVHFVSTLSSYAGYTKPPKKVFTPEEIAAKKAIRDHVKALGDKVEAGDIAAGVDKAVAAAHAKSVRSNYYKEKNMTPSKKQYDLAYATALSERKTPAEADVVAKGAQQEFIKSTRAAALLKSREAKKIQMQDPSYVKPPSRQPTFNCYIKRILANVYDAQGIPDKSIQTNHGFVDHLNSIVINIIQRMASLGLSILSHGKGRTFTRSTAITVIESILTSVGLPEAEKASMLAQLECKHNALVLLVKTAKEQSAVVKQQKLDAMTPEAFAEHVSKRLEHEAKLAAAKEARKVARVAKLQQELAKLTTPQ